ncbi:MAG TPA: SRPBCC family protein [Candidatus Limnocylindria bacterium]|nr:SRPBCC family protein [Candidatus Limnocylindria bacterium]
MPEVAEGQASAVDDGAVTRMVEIQATSETLFAYFIDPDRLVRWMGISATLEPRPGGIFRLDYGDGRGVVRGEYLVVEPPTRVVFTWGWEDPEVLIQPGQSTVEVTIEQLDRSSRLTLRHTGLTGPSRLSHAEGWDWFLPRLAEAAAAGS